MSETVANANSQGKMPVLSAKGIWKSYGRVAALRGVDIEVYPGEVLGLVGDNGAGKSTLIKCITGAEYPDSGTINLDGEDVVFHGPLPGSKQSIRCWAWPLSSTLRAISTWAVRYAKRGS